MGLKMPQPEPRPCEKFRKRICLNERFLTHLPTRPECKAVVAYLWRDSALRIWLRKYHLIERNYRHAAELRYCSSRGLCHLTADEHASTVERHVSAKLSCYFERVACSCNPVSAPRPLAKTVLL